MKVKARKLLSLLLTLAMVVGMFVLPASAASLGENSQYIIDFGANDGTTLPTPVKDSIYNLNSTQGKKDISYTYDSREYKTAAKFDSGGKITVTPDANGTLKIVIIAAKDGSTLSFCGEEKSLGKTAVVEFTKTLEADKSYIIERKKNELHVLRLEFTPAPAVPGEGESTMSFVIPTGITVSEVKEGETVKKLAKTGETRSLFATAGATVTFKLSADKGYTVSKVMAGESELTETEGVYTATMPAVGATTTVTITASADLNPATKVELDAATAELKANGTKNLTATLTVQTEGKDCTDTVEWTSSNVNVATVDETGKVTAKAIGQTTITAKANDTVSDTCVVSVVGDDQSGTTYVMESKKMAAAAANQLEDVDGIKYDNYFTVYTKNKIDGSNKSWSDNYESGQRINFNAGAAVNTESVKFTTSKAATVKVWWVANKENYNMTMLGSTGTAVAGAPSTETSTANSTYVSTFEAPAAGTYYVGGDGVGNYVFKIEVTEKEATPPEPTLKTMKDASPAVQRIVYNGQPITAKVKVVDEKTGADIPNVTYTYGTSAEGPFTSTVPSQKNGGQTTYWFHAEAEGYEPFTSTSGRTLTVNKANPKLTIVAKPDRVKQANDADRFTTLTVTCDLSFADVDKVTVTGADKDGNALPASKIVKVEGQKGVYTVHFNEPDTQIVYIFTASYDGKNADGSVNPNFNAATDTTANVTVINHTVPDRTYELTYDAKHIKITYPDSQGSTDKKVLYGAGVVAEAINIPEGQVFDCWVSADVTDPADKDWATKNPTKFAMPGKNVHLEVKFKAKTEETEADTKTLTARLRTAEGWRDYPVVATAAADVDKGEKWVTADEKEDFNKVIAAAQAVASSEKPTQAQVDEAEKKLEKAIEDFKGNFKDGTKSSGSSETTDTATLNCRDIVTTADREPLTTEQVSAKGPFGVTGEVIKRKSTTPGENVARAFLVSKNGRGTITITVPANSTADIEAVVASSNSDNPTNFALKLGSETKENEENITSAKNSPDTTVNWKALPTGTYSLTTTGSYDMFVRKITVITTTTSDGKPEVPQTEARKDLKAAIETAKKAVADAKVSTDGSEYSKDEKWVTAADKAALESAIELAEAKANSARFNDTALTEAKTALESAKALFEAAKQDGTKTSSSSGGGSSSNVPSSSGGTTVKNEDGSKTTTKTNKATGTVTETTTWPNGDKQVVVTEKDGTKTETVTKKDGTKTETVTKPDGSTTTAVTDAKGIKTETAVSASGETSAKVTLPKTVNKTVVTIPVKDATEGTVAVIVDAKGNETVIKTAVASENGLDLLVTGNVSVKIKDNAKKFNDIDDGYWAKGAVDFVSSREIFKGTTDVTFAPTALVDRGMMATVLFRLADAKAEGENAFFDVPDGNWYTEAVTWANRSGVVTGYADGTFGPADAVTREQMATMLFRYAKVMGMDVSAKGDVSKFSDANDVSSWASEAMTWAVGVGLINGVADPVTGTTLSPAKTASRAEVATIMQRMVKLMMQ